MQIKLSHTRNRNKRAAILLGILVIAALALGGCAAYKVLKKARQIEEQRRQQQASNDLVEAHFDFPAANLTPPAPYAGPIQEGLIDPVTGLCVPKFNVNTNYYNEALEDESGF